MQQLFTKLKLFSCLLVVPPILALATWLDHQPNRWPAPDRVVALRATPVRLPGFAQAWRLRAADERFGGLSALAVVDGDLVALTDSAVIVRFAPPGSGRPSRVLLHDLPGGPGSALRKALRDSESLLADPAGRGWWVAFEHRHSLLLYDRNFTRVVVKRRLNVDWPSNLGGEALVAAADGSIMVLPEVGGRAAGGTMIAPAGTSDAARLPDGRLALLNRRLTLAGFSNVVSIGAGRGKPAQRIVLRLRPLDNMEGIAAVRLPDGGTRLWIVSDDNFRPWMRTLLVALDI